MEFKVIKKSGQGRAGKIKTVHGNIDTPAFMAVGTQGTVKAMRPNELKKLGAQIILGNTYHLFLRPGLDIVRRLGGLHKFLGWNGPILTDSGGFQVFSLGKRLENQEQQKVNSKEQKHKEKTQKELSKIEVINNSDFSGSLVKITEDGVVFKSHIDGSKHLFTPEKVIDIQLELGSDIMMPLDYCPSAEADEGEIKKAVEYTNRWFERTWLYFQKQKAKRKERKEGTPGLFAIVQGGTYKKLRRDSYNFLSQFPVDGFSIGGVANAGESKEKQKAALENTMPLLPADKPRYLMGVGEPEDMISAIKQGVDMFDCVLPTRLARHGIAWLRRVRNQQYGKFEEIDLRKGIYRGDKEPIMAGCGCDGCVNFSRAYIHHLFKSKEILGIRILTEHNLKLVYDLFKNIREG